MALATLSFQRGVTKMALNSKAATAALKRPGRFLYVTYGSDTCFQIEGEGVITRKLANELTGDLFVTMTNKPLPIQRVGQAVEPPLVGAEDGLFPGFSQTYWPDPDSA